MQRRPAPLFATFFSFVFFFFLAQSNAQPVNRIPALIDNSHVISLVGNRYPLALPQFDQGAAAASTPMDHMILVLKSDPAREGELEDLLAAQQDPHSPLYHQWLTPEAFADRFGVSSDDLGRIVSWLGAQGFTIDELPAGGRSIIFSGSAGQVDAAFHTAMHRYRVGGQMHLANATDPEIPQALAGVVAGISTLHDFRRQPMHSAAHAVPAYSAGGSSYYLSPNDFSTIYDVNSLYAGGINGAGQTIAIVARCNIPISDVQTFRQTFGLAANNPTVLVNGTNPGITSSAELDEADLDVQWSGAVAPQATIDFVVSASTNTSDGVDLSAQYIVSHNLAGVMSTSFGSCEAAMGSTERSFYNSLWQQAAAQGITAFIASGDSGAAGCDGGSESQATGGQAVNGLCSTPYSVCVGGTEFSEGSNGSQYWSSSNASNWSSALGYIPEKVWNESANAGGTGLWAGGGGVSAYYTKPSWQSAPGVPADGKRDVPDVSLTAAGHDAYLMFLQGTLVAISGTSAASPSFAGLMALVNQQTGSRQGNANTTFYALATLQASGGQSYFHDVTTGNNTVPGVTGFTAGTGYDQASGLGSVDAATLVNHWNDTSSSAPSFTVGVSPATLSVAAGAAGRVTVQVGATGGFNSAVALAVSGLPTGVTATLGKSTLAAPGSGSTSLTISTTASAAAGVYALQIAATGSGVTQSSTLSLTITKATGCTLSAAPSSLALNPSSSAYTQVSCGSVQSGFNSALKLTVSGAPSGVTAAFSTTSLAPGTAQSKLTVTTTSAVSAQTVSLTVTATGGGLTLSLPISVTINPAPTFTLSIASAALAVPPGTTSQLTLTTAAVGTFNSAVSLSATGVPSGVTATFSPASIPAGNGSSTLTIVTTSTASGGSYTVTLKATGGGLTRTQNMVLSIPAFTLTAAQKSLTVGQGTIAATSLTLSGVTGGFHSAVALSVAVTNGASLPAGLNPSFTPASVTAPGTSILSFAPDNSSKAGTYALSITATGGGLTRTAAFSLTVTPPPSFSLHGAAASISVVAGGAGSTQLTSTAVYGFSSLVALSASHLPAGVAATFTPASMSGSTGKTTINLQTTSSATPGSYTLTISATGGGVTATLPLTLNIGQIVVAPQASALSVKHGSSGSVVVKTSVTGFYSGTTTFAVTGLPKGVTASFSPASVTNPAAGSTTLKLTSAASAAIGTQAVTVTVTSDGVTATNTLNLTVQ